MEHNDRQEQSANPTMTNQGIPLISPAQSKIVAAAPGTALPCPTCAGGADATPPSYVYAIGRIEARFPRLSVEKEFAQAIGRTDTAGQTDQEAFYHALSSRENRYLTPVVLGDDHSGLGNLPASAQGSHGF
ncbi:MAG: hypothetical protein R3E79_59135 [Caldilineaceae bacterium]